MGQSYPSLHRDRSLGETAAVEKRSAEERKEDDSKKGGDKEDTKSELASFGSSGRLPVLPPSISPSEGD